MTQFHAVSYLFRELKLAINDFIKIVSINSDKKPVYRSKYNFPIIIIIISCTSCEERLRIKRYLYNLNGAG
jgi:hypothetical protein